jgi:hypothetical protein
MNKFYIALIGVDESFWVYIDYEITNNYIEFINSVVRVVVDVLIHICLYLFHFYIIYFS